MGLPENSESPIATEADSSPPPLKRFMVRAICCIFVPPAFATYYVWTYVTMLRPSPFPASNINDFIPDGKLVWWSWFIIGAIGLNVSNYVLAGVEAGMLKSEAIGRLGESQVLMHTDKSWSTLSGWKQMAGVFLHWIRAPKSSKQRAMSVPSRIWFILFVFSVFSWAFVLSGLTMETKDYYKAGHDIGAPVVGANVSNFNGRFVSNIVDAAYQEWKQGVQAQMPYIGAIYTPPGDNSYIKVLGGNTLSDFPEYFLAPQSAPPDAYAFSKYPNPVLVTGSAWGIVFKYRCYQVFSMSDFTILNQRINTSNPNYLPPPHSPDGFDYFHYYYNVSDGASISVLTQIGGKMSTSESNTEGVAEVGFSAGFASLLDPNSYGYTPESYKGLDDEVVLEYALWQSIIPGYGELWPPAEAIDELDGEYKDQLNQSMQAVGTRCTSSSVAGVAKINGFDGTFTDFQRQDPDTSVNTSIIPRFSLAHAAILLPSNLVATDNAPTILYNTSAFSQLNPRNSTTSSVKYTLVSTGNRFILPLFQAAGDVFSLPSLSGYAYQRFLDNIDLGQAVMLAYDQCAVQLMYNEESIDWPWSHLTIADGIPWTILVPSKGGVPPLLVLVFLVAWAAGCMILGLRFGFTQRWESSFGVVSWYWYCKEIAHVDPDKVLRSA